MCILYTDYKYCVVNTQVSQAILNSSTHHTYTILPPDGCRIVYFVALSPRNVNGWTNLYEWNFHSQLCQLKWMWGCKIARGRIVFILEKWNWMAGIHKYTDTQTHARTLMLREMLICTVHTPFISVGVLCACVPECLFVSSVRTISLSLPVFLIYSLPLSSFHS